MSAGVALSSGAGPVLSVESLRRRRCALRSWHAKVLELSDPSVSWNRSDGTSTVAVVGDSSRGVDAILFIKMGGDGGGIPDTVNGPEDTVLRQTFGDNLIRN
jgi:hypothetical protein